MNAVFLDPAGKYTGFDLPEIALIYNGEKIVVLSFFDGDEIRVCYNGMCVKVQNYATNGVFTAPSGEENTYEDWRFALAGDCDGNGAADTQDYSVAVNKALAGTPITTVFDR